MRLSMRMSRYIHLYFVAKGRDREQYAEPLTKRAGGWCEPVSGNADLARGPRAAIERTSARGSHVRYQRARAEIDRGCGAVVAHHTGSVGVRGSNPLSSTSRFSTGVVPRKSPSVPLSGTAGGAEGVLYFGERRREMAVMKQRIDRYEPASIESKRSEEH